jgi:hypothetical protein
LTPQPGVYSLVWSGWCAGLYQLPGRIAQFLVKGRESGLSLFRLDEVAFRHNRKQLRSGIASGAFKHSEILHDVSVAIRASPPVVNDGAGRIVNRDRGLVHCADNLIEYVVHRVPVALNATSVAMASQEDNLRRYQRLPMSRPTAVDLPKLRLCQCADIDESNPLTPLQGFEVGPYLIYCVRIEWHRSIDRKWVRMRLRCGRTSVVPGDYFYLPDDVLH